MRGAGRRVKWAVCNGVGVGGWRREVGDVGRV